MGEWLGLLKRLEPSRAVFCHNDLLLKNIVWNEDLGTPSLLQFRPGWRRVGTAGRADFIDYEYAGFNFRAFDIGDHFTEYAGTFPPLSLQQESTREALGGVEEIDFSLQPDEAYMRAWLGDYAKAVEGLGGPRPDEERLLRAVQVSSAVASLPCPPLELE